MQPTWPRAVWATTTNGGISLDAVREFRVFTSNKPADAGAKSEVLIAITTKSRRHLVSCLVRWHDCGFRWMWTIIPFHVGQHYGDVGRCLGDAGQPGLPQWFGHQVLA
jgi:hypothetical protein